MPVIDTNNGALEHALTQAAEGPGASQIIDPNYPDDVVAAAGAPWFMTLFGRDSIIASRMALFVDPDLTLGVVRTLARWQGTTENAETEE